MGYVERDSKEKRHFMKGMERGRVVQKREDISEFLKDLKSGAEWDELIKKWGARLKNEG